MTLSNVCFAQAQHSHWKLEQRKLNVELFSRTLNNGYKEVLAKTTVSSRISALLNLLHDIKEAPYWIHNASQITLLAQPTPNQSVIHAFFHSPWPLENRDMITQSIAHQDPSTLTLEITVTDKGDAYAHQPNFVRMLDIHGIWRVFPSEEGLITISYQGTGNPAGNIPRWLANKVLISSTFKTFLKMRQKITHTKYQNKPLTYIEEP